ncbi:phage terminase large subunit [Sphingomonas sp.]|uniref:phage terminase large subunit n=1 Tax=Sphingomonas sp. TaxID=28214 RepID=UPI0017A1A0F5|nr:phage terminase large subunit [Sphingomonas sp.]MBA3512327.1 phage terminase large subunit [Sphingomonas sp.]
MPRSLEPDDPHAVLQKILRNDFRAFLRKAFPSIRGGSPLAWNWHLDAIAHQLACIQSGDNRQLLVTMPPRNLKSITISIAWVAWMLGRNPRHNFVCVSYSNDLSAKHARDCLALMQSSWYRKLFPGTILSSARPAASDFETTMGGGRLATSLTGTLTGRGGDIVIIDDPIKPDEAHSEVSRQKANDWFKSTLTTRLDNKGTGSVVVVMQRLHEYDLAGMLIEAGGWYLLSLPAIALEDETVPLCGGRFHTRSANDLLHPEWESREALERQRLLMGSMNFDAQYQQQPVPAGGNIIKAEWLKTYEPGFDPSTHSGHIIQSWDTASKDGALNDFSVCITALMHRGTVWILDVFRAKLSFPDLKFQFIRLAREFSPQTILVEDAASGMQLIQTIRAEKPAGVPQPVARRPDSDKVSRMAGVSGQVASGQLLLPIDAGWLASFKSEILGFPALRYDDQADALTQLMSWAMQLEAYNNNGENAGPIVFLFDDDGTSEIIGDAEGIFSGRTRFSPDDDPWL